MATVTFVWAHALLGSVAWEDEVGLFDWPPAAEFANVVRYDARSYRWPALVDDLLRAGGSGPFVAGGAGMGAATALLAAVRAPRRIQALVLATPPTAWETRAAEGDLYEELAATAERHGPAALAEWVWPAGGPAFVAGSLAAGAAARHLAGMDKKIVPAVLRGAGSSDLATKAEVRGVIVPTLILAWEGDPGHPASTARHLADLMVQSELHLASDLDDVRAWPGRISAFLAGV